MRLAKLVKLLFVIFFIGSCIPEPQFQVQEPNEETPKDPSEEQKPDDKPVTPPEDDPTLGQIQVSRLAIADGKTYVEVDGKPFAFMGAQIRLDVLLNCEQRTLSAVEPYFTKAAELGVNCVQIPICWNMIEPEKDQYDFSVVDAMLGYCNKYNLKMELLWFSTNMCGESFSYYVPQYILGDPDKRLYRNDEGWFWNYYGYMYALILDDEYILERETKAVTQLFNHIRQWDYRNGEKHPVITAQIHNEPDIFVRWRYDQKGYRYRDNSRTFNKDIAWDMVLNSLDAVGQAVQKSDYKVLTRVNLVKGDGLNPFPEATSATPREVFDLPGIDFISVDIYRNSIADVKYEVDAYASIQGNYALVAENKGVYSHSPSLILTAFANGGGYDIYDLATPEFLLNNTDNRDEVDQGVYTYDLQERPVTVSTRKIVKGIVGASEDIALTPPNDFAAFNVVTDVPKVNTSETIATTSLSVSFSTSSTALGFALDRGDYAILYATAQADFVVVETATSQRREISTQGGEVLKIQLGGTAKPGLGISPKMIATTQVSGEYVLSITSRGDWKITVGEDARQWCSAETLTGSGSAEVRLSLSEVPDDGTAIGHVTVSTADGQASETLTIQHGYARKIGDVIWAKANVDQPGYFAASPDARGKLYQYSSAVPWPNSCGVEDNSTPSGYPYGAIDNFIQDWTAESDPCPEGWTIPTLEQIHLLVGANGEKKLWRTKEESKFSLHGAVFGISADDAKNAVKGDLKGGIFVPEAGFRERDSGYQAHYWEACFTSRTRPEGQTWDRYVVSTDGNGWFGIYHDGNYAAFPVRCVAK